MGQTAKRTRENRTITVDFQDDSTYFQLINDGKAFMEFVLAFVTFRIICRISELFVVSPTCC